MAYWKIINPSDPYQIQVDDLDVAAVACVLLGHGSYGLKEQVDQPRDVPIFLLGGAEVWFKETFGQGVQCVIESVMAEKTDELIAALDSVTYGSLDEVKTFEQARQALGENEDAAAWREQWHEERISSVNHIGRRAWEMAKSLRERRH